MTWRLAGKINCLKKVKVILCLLALFCQTPIQATNFDPALTFASRKLGTGGEGSDFINQFDRVGFGGGKYVAWSSWYSPDIFLSEDGVQWTQRSVSAQAGDYVLGCAFNGMQWLSVLRDVNTGGPVFSKSTDGGMNWQKVEGVSLPQEYIYPVDLASVGGSWVLVGNGSSPSYGGRVWISSDGVNWVDCSAAGMPTGQVVGYGNGALVVVGPGGKIYRSTDLGQSWTTPASGTTQRFRSVAYGNGRFVVVGEGGVLLTSTDDGATWVSQASGTINFLTSVTFGNGVFVVSNNGSAMSSYDGIAWTSASGQGLGWGANHRSLVYGVAGFVGLTSGGNLIQSVSGSVPVWGPLTTQIDATVGSPYSVSLATTGATSYQALNLPAGLTLNSTTGQLSGTPTVAGTVAFYVYPVNAAGVGNYTTFTLTVRNAGAPPPPALTFASRKLGTGGEGSDFINQFDRVGFGGGKYVAWSSWYSPDIFLSEDGVQWTQRSVSAQAGDYVLGCAFNGMQWLSVLRDVNTGGPVFSKSTDGGMNWQKVEGVSLPQEYIYPVDLASVGGSWVLVGNGSSPSYGGRVWISSDGVNWVDCSAAGMPTGQVVGYGNGALVVVGPGGKIYRSTDLGQSWTTPASGTTQRFRSVAYGNGRFVVVGEGGVLLTSTDDGATWVSQASGTINFLTSVTFGNGVFVVSNNGSAMSSYDGIAWTSASGQGLGWGANHRSLVYGVAGFVGLTSGGNLIQSVSGSVPVWGPLTTQIDATVGSPYSVSLATTGATSYQALNLPAGLTLNSTTGQLSGTPTVAGTVAFYVYPVNAAGVGNYTTFTLTVRNPPENPLITLMGENPIVLWRMTAFTDPGATVTDNRDATRTIFGTGTVNTGVIGAYTLTYNATDSEGYPAITRTRTVEVVAENTDLTAPQITEFSITPGSVDITGSSRTVTVTARITDDLSGLSWAHLIFQS